jgi:hypothetical protein
MRAPLLLTLLALAACEGPPPAVVVGPLSFTEDQLLGLSRARRETLANLTAFGLAVADSGTAALGAPLIRRWEDDRLLEILAARLALEKNGIGDAVLEARYLVDPEHELLVRHILFFSERWRTPAERQAAEEKARGALRLLREGADFAETAARMSEEPGAESRQGLLTPGREGAWVDEFWAAASALEVGEISGVTETRYGFHILRLEGREVVPFREARSRVARDVADRIEDPQAVLTSWMETAKRSLELRAVSTESLPDSATIAAWPGGRLTIADLAAWSTTELATSVAVGPSPGSPGEATSVETLALRRLALDEAERRVLEVPEQERAEIARRWDDMVYRWSTSLGFDSGMPVSGVVGASLDALAETGQGATIARRELDDRAPLLRAAYIVEVAPAG